MSNQKPNILLTPLDWAAQAQRQAAEYAGLPEAQWFLVEARRYLALYERIKELEAQIPKPSVITSSSDIVGV